jgi:carbamoyl-phosphate synthase small subunit
MLMEAYLILQNGAVFKGEAFGRFGEAVGELIFNTGMVGYQELLTDPLSEGQIVMQTFPLVGNYGIIPEDNKTGEVFPVGYVVREHCEEPSNFRSRGTLAEFLKKNGVVGIFGVDTRAITRILRDEGTMNAKISLKADLSEAELKELKEYKPCEVNRYAKRKAVQVKAPEKIEYKVAILDFGTSVYMEDAFLERNCEVTVIPYGMTADEIVKLSPHGIILSGGPGDPIEYCGAIAEISKLYGQIPLLGIGLGHQLLALSQGAKIEKLPHGHRGANQPVEETATGKVRITTQNHGYAVVAESLPKSARVSFRNVHDLSCEGVEYENKAFGVQFVPECSGSPHDTEFLYDRFIGLIKKEEDVCR